MTNSLLHVRFLCAEIVTATVMGNSIIVMKFVSCISPLDWSKKWFKRDF